MAEENDRSEEDVQPPRKKLRALRKAVNPLSGRDSRGHGSTIQTLPVAGGPDALSLKRFELWKIGLVCDFDLICSDGVVIKATRLELAVWSEFFRAHLLGSSGKEHTEMEIAQADSEIVATLVQSLYEKEITVTALNAHMLLALADRLRIPPILEVVERYLISQINHENAVEALLMAEKHNCMLLRQAAIPLTATNFDRIDPGQLTMLTANDMQELLASDQLSSTEEHTLFAIVKQWSKGQDHGFHSAETEQAILRLVKEIRLEHIGSEKLATILDDPWLQQHPLVLSAVAKALITKKDLASPNSRTNRVGQVVRFSDWSVKRAEAQDSQAQGQTRQPIYSPNFVLQLPGQESMEAHVQVYPGGFSKHPEKIGIFLAGNQGKENQSPLPQKFRITIVNQHNHKDSVTAEFKTPTSSTGGTLKFWGSQQFISAAALEKGFLVDDTLTISIVAVTNGASHKMMSPSPLKRQALSERESST